RSYGLMSMQAADAVMPLEGAFLAIDNPYLWHIFVTHQLAKFSFYLAGRFLPPRGMLSFIPQGYEGAFPEEAQLFAGLPLFEMFSTQEKISEFLESSEYSNKDKLNFLNYLLKIHKKDKAVLAETPEFADIVDSTVDVYVKHVKDFLLGKELEKEISAIEKELRDLREDDVRVDRKIREDQSGLTRKIAFQIVKRELKSQVSNLKAKKTLVSKMLELLKTISTYDERIKDQIDFTSFSMPVFCFNLF
ncbi:MAG: hypothetical protein ABIA04_04705, partial [Pseudomonadota bacterium]